MIAGVDEAGCGTLVGPLVAAAVCLPAELEASGFKDSKQLSAKKREKMYDLITSRAHVGIGVVTLDEINTIPFSNARKLVFRRAVEDLSAHTSVEKLIIDGSGFFEGFNNVPFECVVKADAKYPCVSAASIVAKTVRDNFIAELCEEDGHNAARYSWHKNKGYPTREHINAIRQYGITPHHRIHFKPCQPTN